MQLTVTEDQLIEAAQKLDQDEFTRADVAGELGVDKPDLKQAFVHARKAGRLIKVRDDEENTGHFRLVWNGKLAGGSVSTEKLAAGAVGNDQVKNDSIQPGKLTFPVFYVATPAGGSQPVTNGQEPYPLSNGQWTQRKDAVNVVFGSGTATLAYDGSGSGSCQVFFDIRVDGQQVGGGQLQTSSTTPEQVTQQIGAAPGAGPTQATERTLTVQVGSNGDCEVGSTIDSTRFQVLNFG